MAGPDGLTCTTTPPPPPPPRLPSAISTSERRQTAEEKLDLISPLKELRDPVAPSCIHAAWHQVQSNFFLVLCCVCMWGEKESKLGGLFRVQCVCLCVDVVVFLRVQTVSVCLLSNNYLYIQYVYIQYVCLWVCCNKCVLLQPLFSWAEHLSQQPALRSICLWWKENKKIFPFQ